MLSRHKYKLHKTLSCFDKHVLDPFMATTPRVKDLVLHKIKKTGDSNIIDPLVMDSFNRVAFNRDVTITTPRVNKTNFDFFIDKDEFVKNLRSNIPIFTKPEKGKGIKRSVYFNKVFKIKSMMKKK
jgi:hypothetical protein